MRTTTLFLALGTTLAVTACSSTPYNPNYQQTTQYKGSNPYATTQQSPIVQRAGYVVETQTPAPVVQYVEPAQYTYTQVQADCLNTNAHRTGEAASPFVVESTERYAITERTTCHPIPVGTPKQATITPAYTGPGVTSVSTTRVHAEPNNTGIEENIQDFGDAGTPGYYAINGYPQAEEAEISTQLAITEAIETPNIQALPYQPITPPKSEQEVFIAQTVQINFAELDTYTVQPGNTVYSLARESCVSVPELKTLNGINEEFYIRAGDSIKIPTGRCPAK